MLEERLSQPLPGPLAQRRMMPAGNVEDRFNLNKDDARLGGVLALFYLKEGEIYIPLTQRHSYPGTHGGQISFPGGKWEEGDGDLETTAVRETHEEIGVDLSAIKIMGKLSDLYIPPSNFKVSPYVGYLEKAPHFVIDQYEVKDLMEVPIRLLIDKNNHKRKDITVRSSLRLKAPYFDLYGKVVWGATAMMLAELVTLLEELEDSDSESPFW